MLQEKIWICGPMARLRYGINNTNSFIIFQMMHMLHGKRHMIYWTMIMNGPVLPLNANHCPVIHHITSSYHHIIILSPHNMTSKTTSLCQFIFAFLTITFPSSYFIPNSSSIPTLTLHLFYSSFIFYCVQPRWVTLPTHCLIL